MYFHLDLLLFDQQLILNDSVLIKAAEAAAAAELVQVYLGPQLQPCVKMGLCELTLVHVCCRLVIHVYQHQHLDFWSVQEPVLRVGTAAVAIELKQQDQKRSHHGLLDQKALLHGRQGQSQQIFDYLHWVENLLRTILADFLQKVRMAKAEILEEI